MTTAFWIADVLLGIVFIITGSFKFFQPREKIIASGGTWAADFNPGVIKTIAAAELLSGLLVIIPKLLGQAAYLTFTGACCISLIMAGSIWVHIRRREFSHAGINLVLLLIALFVVYAGRP